MPCSRWIDLFVNAAAAGCPRETLEALEGLPGTDLMEPLIAGIQLFLGEKVNAPAEVLEVARDVKQRIAEQSEKMKNEALIKPKQ
jgi:hypothetical protein